MENTLLPATGSTEKKIVIFIVLVIVAGVCGFAGYRQAMKWHETSLQAVRDRHQHELDRATTALRDEIQTLQDKLAGQAPTPVGADRMEDVFGPEPVPAKTPAADQTCSALKQKVDAFFNYLAPYCDTADSAAPAHPREIFNDMMLALAASPPLVVGETRDIISLKHNLAHFFRVLKKDRIELIKKILTAEADVLEPAMANFYAYYISCDCCNPSADVCFSLPTLYEYAGFFTSTIAGKSYLFRRPSTIRSLMQYYAVLILDRAETEGENRYGIDIRPHIDLALDAIRSRSDLISQERYIDELSELKEKYAVQFH